VSSNCLKVILLLRIVQKVDQHSLPIPGHFKKSDGSNPYQHYLDLEVTIPQDKLQSHVEKVVDHAVFIFKEMRRIFLVENLVDSVKVIRSSNLFG
jgi:hypothetical protein